ncbi:hypothetical protein [Sansalvadorimonas verongulae]|nr:hypothetical protein [Sansalvadorimonas verongulae]
MKDKAQNNTVQDNKKKEDQNSSVCNFKNNYYGDRVCVTLTTQS